MTATPHYPSLSTTFLPPLSKVRWIDGKAQTVALLRFACDTSTFLIYQTFCRQDGGIATPLSLAPRQPFQNRTIPRKSPPPLPLNERFVGFASLPSQPLVPLHRIPPLPKTTINPKRKALKRSPVAKTGNGASVLYIGFTLSIFQHRQQAQRFRVRDFPSSQAYIRRPKFPLFRRCRQASAYSCYRLPCRLRSACRCLYGR